MMDPVQDVNTDGAYVVARVRAMKSVLFSRDRIEELIALNDVDALVGVLLESDYRQEMAEALTHLQGADAVEEALSRNLVNTLQKLARISQGMLKPITKRFLQRFDLTAAKTLLRLRHHGMDPSSAPGTLFPGPTLTVPRITALAEVPTMEALVQGIQLAWNVKLNSNLGRALREYGEARDLAVLEDALDRSYFVTNVVQLENDEEENAQLLRRLLRIEIDRINLRILFQRQETNLNPDERFARLLPKGLLGESTLRAMTQAQSIDDLMAMLAETPYREIVEGMYEFIQSGRFAPLDRLFERLILEQLARWSRIHVFSVAILMYYAWLKYNEVVNLRIIARGTASHLPLGRIREEVMHV